MARIGELMNKRVLFVAATLAVSAQSMAHIEMFAGTFSGLNENPPNASPGTGSSLVTLDLDMFTMRVQCDFSGLIGTTTASHIHVATSSTANGAVATQTPSFIGFPLGVTSGSMDMTYDMALASSYNSSFITANGGTVSTAFTALYNALSQGRAYHNIHTSFAGGGEIRANLVPVPEPGTYAALGLGVVALFGRRRKNA